MKKIIYAIFVLFLVSCSSSPMDRKFNEDALENDLKAIRESKELDSAESLLLAEYFVRAKVKGDDLRGKTYADLLAAAKADKETSGKTENSNEEDDKQENFSLADKVGDEQKIKLANLNEALDVEFLEKAFFGEVSPKYMSFEFAFKNNSDKEIKNINGDAIFSDLEGNKVKTITLKYEGAIKPNETIQFASSTDYFESDEKDKMMVSKKKEELKMEWSPKNIIYADGSAVK